MIKEFIFDKENMNSNYNELRLSLLDKRLEIFTLLKKGYFESNEAAAYKDLAITSSEVQKLLDQKSFGIEHLMIPLDELHESIKLLEQQINDLENKAQNEGVILTLKYLEEVFQLTFYDKLCLEMALAYELEDKYKKIYAYLNNDRTKHKPTYQIAYELFQLRLGSKFSIRVLQNENPTLTQMLMKPIGSSEVDYYQMVLDDDVFRWIVGSANIGESSLNYSNLIYPRNKSDSPNWKPSILKLINKYIDVSVEDQKKLIFISGSKGVGKTYQVCQWATEYDCVILSVDYLDLMSSDEDLELYFLKMIRDVNLINGIFLFDNYEHDKNSKREKQFFTLIQKMCNFVFVLSRSPLPHKLELDHFSILNIEIGLLNNQDRKLVWQKFASDKKIRCDQWSNISSGFKFSIGSIKSVINKLYALENWNQGEVLIEESRLFEACYGEIKHELDKKTRKLDAKYTFDDLILPESIIRELSEICSRVKNSDKVYDQWGFGEKLSYGKGLAVVFSGEPGTGKTMSAHAIANELKLEIYQIDLSSMVSKYIGETEKNLSSIFDEAKRSNAILFFDEAESLFGKRTEVSNSNDKHANNQTSFLLQKIEEYEGITILATNFKKSMDKAFIRRMNHIIEFHMPTKEYRKKIWSSIFPERTPMSADIDFDYISEKFELTGGNIKNIALRSAFMAAEKDNEIMMKDILVATKEELHKIGKVFINSQRDEYSELY